MKLTGECYLMVENVKLLAKLSDVTPPPPPPPFVLIDGELE